MNNLIFLGIIPGTNIQINFWDWLIVTIILTAVFIAWFKKIYQKFNYQTEVSIPDDDHQN